MRFIMIDFLKKERLILLLYLFVFATGLAIMFISEKTAIHLFINQHHSSLLDFFFKLTSHLGEGLFAIGVVITLLFIRYRYAIIHFLSFAISGLLAQFFKHLIFPNCDRPKVVFEGIAELRFIEGIKVASYYSFPSGHTTTAFAIFIAMSFMVKSNVLKCFFLLCGVLVGYARMYLSQHFLIDVTFGSLLGTVCAILIFYFSTENKNPKLDLSLSYHIKQVRLKNRVK